MPMAVLPASSTEGEKLKDAPPPVIWKVLVAALVRSRRSRSTQVEAASGDAGVQTIGHSLYTVDQAPKSTL